MAVSNSPPPKKKNSRYAAGYVCGLIGAINNVIAETIVAMSAISRWRPFLGQYLAQFKIIFSTFMTSDFKA